MMPGSFNAARARREACDTFDRTRRTPYDSSGRCRIVSRTDRPGRCRQQYFEQQIIVYRHAHSLSWYAAIRSLTSLTVTCCHVANNIPAHGACQRCCAVLGRAQFRLNAQTDPVIIH